MAPALLTQPTVTEKPPHLEVVDMTKRFGSFTALNNVSMVLRPGSLHALLGENGAGKSTLVKCVMGFYRPTSGTILINNQPHTIQTPQDAHGYGIGMVYQHFTSVPAMTVAENLVLSRHDTPPVLNWKQERAALQAFMAAAPFYVDLDTPVGQLAAGQKQKLEILKQLYLKHRLLILDEPTSVLTPGEADEVLSLLQAAVLQGQLSVLLITHKFREVQAFADEVTILRRGQVAGQGRVQDLSVEAMAEMMLGQARQRKSIAKNTVETSEAVLAVHQLGVNRDNGLPAVQDLTLVVQRGEIVGIAGVSGNGQREFVEVLAGQRSPTTGQICVDGAVYTATRAEMFDHGVYTLPEEPLRNACVPTMNVAENMALRTFDRPPQAHWNWLLILKAIRTAAQTLVTHFSVKTPSVETPVRNLSGGNIQRTVLARELSSPNVRLLIAANPSFGLDFAAVDFIHEKIVEARNRGAAVLLVSEDLDELLALADRILVMSEGKFVYESTIQEADLPTIGQRMAGH